MNISPALKSAFCYHMRNDRPAFWHAHGYTPTVATHKGGTGVAVECMRRARADLDAEKRRYPEPIRQNYREESDGLRFIGRVAPGTNRQIFDTRGDSGWCTDPHGHTTKDGTGLCFGVVYQLPGRKGESRFVAGYQFGGIDGGPTLDLNRVFTEPKSPDSYWIAYGDKDDITTLRHAARHADSMAEAAAEKEREYQIAWQAGNAWENLGEQIATDRAELLAILKERRAVKGTDAPALCAAIRGTVNGLLRSIQRGRAKRAELAAGDSPDLYFWTDEERLRDAFCDGAGLESFPC